MRGTEDEDADGHANGHIDGYANEYANGHANESGSAHVRVHSIGPSLEDCSRSSCLTFREDRHHHLTTPP
jgi:hypothetical protein